MFTIPIAGTTVNLENYLSYLKKMALFPIHVRPNDSLIQKHNNMNKYLATMSKLNGFERVLNEP